MDTILEIIKYTLPAFVVFGTAYLLIKQFTQTQVVLQQENNVHDRSKEQQAEILRIKLQAYERLALLCERISVPNLLVRLRSQSMSNNDLKNALFIAVEQEYEHNLVQQIYVSDKLWQIILATKESILNLIDLEASVLSPNQNATELATALYKRYNDLESNPNLTALSAIKKETSLIL